MATIGSRSPIKSKQAAAWWSRSAAILSTRLLILKDIAPSELLEKGITNPNGIVTDDAGKRIFVFSDTGLAHQFDLDGNLLNLYQTISTGYRGVVRGDDLWVVAWSEPGALAHIHLPTGARTVHPCVPARTA